MDIFETFTKKINSLIQRSKKSKFENNELLHLSHDFKDKYNRAQDELIRYEKLIKFLKFVPGVSSLANGMLSQIENRKNYKMKEDVNSLKSVQRDYDYRLNDVQKDIAELKKKDITESRKNRFLILVLVGFVTILFFIFISINHNASKCQEIPRLQQNLKFGMEGDEVREIEYFLDDLGFDPGRTDGKFDKYTEKAVIKLQRHFSLKEDGIIGPNTISKIREHIALCKR